jgi:hypothetical protein
VSYAVFSLLSIAVAGHAYFRLILLLLVRIVCGNCFLSTNLSSFLFPGCQLLLLLSCLIYVVCSAAWLMQMTLTNNRRIQQKDAWPTTATDTKLNTAYDTFKLI